MKAPATNHLVDEYQVRVLKFNGRTPRTLQELLVAKAELEHRQRMAEIKAMASKLAQLDAFAPLLAERGLGLGRRQITTHDNGKTLRIERPIFSSDDKLHAALIELGFKEVERKAYISTEETVTLKHGRSLQVSIHLVRKAVAAAPAVAETAGAVA